MQKNVREWTFTLPSELPFWEWESQWTLESLKGNYRDQNSLDWDVPSIIGKLLEQKCPKWAYMTHLDTWNTSYGQKKGWESNWQFDSQPLKVENWPDFLACKWCTTNYWKLSTKATTLLQTSSQLEVYEQNYGPPKSRKSQLWEFRVRVLGQNAIWMWASWRGIEYTIRGKVVASPKSRPWWVSWVWICPWFVLAPKML
jgi:hypothetical protein